MAESKLWGVSTKGNVFTLSSHSKHWQQVPNQQHCLRGFKQVAASPQGAWGLGCDHQIYVYVEASDVPIRVQEATYENERWLPTRGWSGNHLIPLDPWKWSGLDGTVYMAKEDFKLPSESWQWEEEWHIDENVAGHLTDKGGWRYGKLDFHGQFTHQRTFNSCVRRRRWIRHRRYVAVSRWTKIPSIHLDPLEEPIIDLALGGHDIPHQKQGHVSVWVVTINGRLFYRNGVTQVCPEGRNWQCIPTGDDHEVLGLGAGPTGLVWAVTWQGALLVRTSVSWKNFKGKDWIEVDLPDDLKQDRVVQVAVGVSSVWIATNSGKMWFRKGVSANSDTLSCEGAVGTGWLKMVHCMRTVFVGAMDQVWGIDREERRLYCRRGISHDEPTGKDWYAIDLPYTSHADLVSMLSVASESDTQLLADSHSLLSVESSTGSIDFNDQTTDPAKGAQCLGTAAVEFPSKDSGKPSNGNVLTGAGCTDDTESDSETAVGRHGLTTAGLSKSSLSNSCSLECSDKMVDVVWDCKSSGEEVQREAGKSNCEDKTEKSDSQTVSFKVDTCQSIMKLEFKQAEALDGLSGSGESSSASALNAEVGIQAIPKLPNFLNVNSMHYAEDPEEVEEATQEEDDFFGHEMTVSPTEDGILQWQWVSATNCTTSHDTLIQQWLTSSSAPAQGSQLSNYHRHLDDCRWRTALLKLLSCRAEREVAPFSATYELAVEKSVWTKKGEMKWWRHTHRPAKWVDCQLELTTDAAGDGNKTLGTFCIQYKLKSQQKFEQYDLAQIVCVQPLLDKFHNTIFGVFTANCVKSVPREACVRLKAASEESMEDWVSTLTRACCEERGLCSAPQNTALWGLTERGDVMVHEVDSQYITETAPTMFWHQLRGHAAKVETNSLGITWAIGYNGTAWVYTGSCGGMSGLHIRHTALYPQSDTKAVYVYENQRWRPVRGYTDRYMVFLADHYMWSDETGKVERTKEGTKLHSKHWKWSGDWAVDRALPGGVDKEGWQYGHNFTGKFYSRPRLRCYLRRRRWIRRYKVSTVGAWLEVGPLPLKDISIQTDPDQGREADTVAVWAIGANGDVLCRVAVTTSNPQGQAWHHVPTDTPFASVSIGCTHQVWATAQDGSAWYRNGVSKEQPTGTCWFQVPPPDGVHLCQISAGLTCVYAVDSKRNLWFRKDTTSTFPEGTQWVKVATRVRQVSVGLRNQVWAILDGIPSRQGPVDGVVSRRISAKAREPKAGTWQHGIGGGWNYICARGWEN